MQPLILMHVFIHPPMALSRQHKLLGVSQDLKKKDCHIGWVGSGTMRNTWDRATLYSCVLWQQSCLTRKAWWQRLVSNGNAGFCLNCCFSIFWTVASQSRIENSQSGWFNKIQQSGMDLLKRGDKINLISDKRPLNMFSSSSFDSGSY